MEWKIFEIHDISKTLRKLPKVVVNKYELWKNLVAAHGPDILRTLPSYHDEKLKGNRYGQRSSRLSLKYRIIYEVVQDKVLVMVFEITPHKY
ncbi:type II toxin-antitoxin system mRNA interferase toxin, RelE/StbE family [bacterium]|nr:type II toxin-antitoxin system mRNA interferase toxin, RelE/StbE family [bacterium]